MIRNEAIGYLFNTYEKQDAADGTIQDSYCQIHVEPKVQKVREKFVDKAKSTNSLEQD